MEVYLLLILASVLLVFCFFLLRLMIRTRNELKEFAEAVEQEDLSRKYPENKPGLSEVNKELNSISRSIRSMNRQRESQQHYLRKILELTDTGILAYHTQKLDILWMNEALGTILDIPLIKNLRWLHKHDED